MGEEGDRPLFNIGLSPPVAVGGCPKKASPELLSIHGTQQCL